MTARDEFRKATAQALIDLRHARPKWAVMPTSADELARSLIGEILALRLEAAYSPIFGTLGRMEAQLAILVASGRDRWAPPPTVQRMPFRIEAELPEFLRPAVTNGDRGSAA